MSNGSLTTIGLALALGVLVAVVSVPVSAVVVTFPDPGLEEAIREAIRKPTGAIQSTDLIGLRSLNADNRGIVNLEGIQYCTDLTGLSLSINEIVDISALAGLTNLIVLSLYDNKIVDISALEGLINLEKIELGNNQISDILPLVNNPGIGSGDYVDLQYNLLTLAPGSSDMLNIEALQGRGVNVNVGSQN